MNIREILFFNLFALIMALTTVYSQEDTKIVIFHGKHGQSNIIKVIKNGEALSKEGRRVTLTEPIGSEVRIEVINCNPIYYNYAFTTKIDSFKTPNIGISKLLSNIQPLTSKEDIIPGATGKNPSDTKDKTNLTMTEILQKINGLLDDFDKMRKIVKISEEPDYTFVMNYKQSELNKAISDINAEDFGNSKINDVKLRSIVEAWFENYDEATCTEGIEKVIKELRDLTVNKFPELDKNKVGEIFNNYKPQEFAYNINSIRKMMMNYTTYLIDEIETFKKNIKENSKPVSKLIKVTDDETLIKLKINSKGDNTKGQEPIRETGDNIVEIIIKSEYNRPKLEIVPISYTLFSKNVTNFNIINGIITEGRKAESFNFRVGGMISINFYNFGERKEFAASAGIGSNVLGGESIFTDFFLGGFLSYRDIFRAGVGWGFSKISEKLKSGVTTGKALPENTTLNDYIEKEDKNSVFLIFSLTGWSLPLLK